MAGAIEKRRKLRKTDVNCLSFSFLSFCFSRVRVSARHTSLPIKNERHYPSKYLHASRKNVVEFSPRQCGPLFRYIFLFPRRIEENLARPTIESNEISLPLVSFWSLSGPGEFAIFSRDSFMLLKILTLRHCSLSSALTLSLTTVFLNLWANFIRRINYWMTNSNNIDSMQIVTTS